MTLQFNDATKCYEGDGISVRAELLERRVREAIARGEREEQARAWLSQARWWSRSAQGVEALPQASSEPVGLSRLAHDGVS